MVGVRAAGWERMGANVLCKSPGRQRYSTVIVRMGMGRGGGQKVVRRKGERRVGMNLDCQCDTPPCL
jgi:hypothetical protein